MGAGPRGSYLHDGEKTYAIVDSLGGGWRGPVTGWYWYTSSSDKIPRMNTSNAPCKTPEEAKEQAKEFVVKHLESK
ncbi:MAG TPA: hypothetical protein DCS09_08545 [Porphyromonadaceae bacterium]|nr:hypothetical protein [Porphyromonadaceae bacterium]